MTYKKAIYIPTILEVRSLKIKELTGVIIPEASLWHADKSPWLYSWLSIRRLLTSQVMFLRFMILYWLYFVIQNTDWRTSAIANIFIFYWICLLEAQNKVIIEVLGVRAQYIHLDTQLRVWQLLLKQANKTSKQKTESNECWQGCGVLESCWTLGRIIMLCNHYGK